MFEKEIPIIEQFTRPLLAISRKFGSEKIFQESSTIFFVNEFGCALTTYDIAGKFFPYKPYLENYKEYKQRILMPDCDIEKVKLDFGYENNEALIDLKTIFLNCGENISRVSTLIHPSYNLALLYFEGNPHFTYKGYARFCINIEKFEKGKELMRLGFPFPRNSNHSYNQSADEIGWDKKVPFIIDSFPLKGIITRNLYSNNLFIGVELNTPGYKGHEGSPLFDEYGSIFGMHCTNSTQGDGENYNNPTPSFGQCISSSAITQFLLELGVKFYQVEEGKEVVYNEKGNKPVFQKKLLPSVYISGEGESSIHVKEIRAEIRGKVVVDYKEPFQVAIGKTDDGSKKEGSALIQFSLDGKNEIFISEENAGNVSLLEKNSLFKLKVTKKMISSPKWKIKVSVKTQSSYPFNYFDILILRRNVERNHKKDPHLAFYPDASGKYIRYDNEKKIRLLTTKTVLNKKNLIIPLKSKIEADEFQLEIIYTFEEDVLNISDLLFSDK